MPQRMLARLDAATTAASNSLPNATCASSRRLSTALFTT
ncbi:hypothetical protein I553_3006 [Mycobacterium xenopi 4042]|uniref:Uncharacterized protein n=1 Tax=Mycobacterium xenopi 4042 TaxID=1299334 RepID=X8EFU2_MYCXE|nr:hypothetical protein I553_3006 [Mycobacterium xenopi 4042]